MVNALGDRIFLFLVYYIPVLNLHCIGKTQNSYLILQIFPKWIRWKKKRRFGAKKRRKLITPRTLDAKLKTVEQK